MASREVARQGIPDVVALARRAEWRARPVTPLASGQAVP